MVSRSAVKPANQFRVMLRYDDFSLKDVMEDYGFGIEEIKIRIPGVWGQRWLGTAWGFVRFFFHTMYQLKGKPLRNLQLDFCRRVQPLGGFRIYHCSKDIQTLGTPRS